MSKDIVEDSDSSRCSVVRPRRPVVRYHGGKWRLGEWIISNFPKHRIYTESFGGGGSVLLQKPRVYAEVYNDLDGEIVNLFRVIRDSGKELERRVRLSPFSRYEFEESYIPAEDSIEQARRTLVRSFMGFGSASASGAKTGFRANSNRSGTTPAHDWGNYPKCIDALTERLKGVVIENRDAKEVMLSHDSDETLHYVDPPYVLDTRSMKNPYCKKGYRFELTDEDHRELAGFLKGLKGAVVLSGYKSSLYEELYSGWRMVTKQTMADGARERTEVLWMHNVNHESLLF